MYISLVLRTLVTIKRTVLKSVDENLYLTLITYTHQLLITLQILLLFSQSFDWYLLLFTYSFHLTIYNTVDGKQPYTTFSEYLLLDEYKRK